MIAERRTFPLPGVTLIAGALVVGLFAVELLIGFERLPLAAIPREPLALLGLVGAGVGVLLMLARIQVGIILLPIVATLVPFAVGTSTQSTLVASLLLCSVLIVLWVARMIARRELKLMDSPVNAPLLGFMAVAVVATLAANVVRPPLVVVQDNFSQVQLGGAAMFVVSGGLLLMVMNTFKELRWVEWLVWVFLGIGAVDLIYAFGTASDRLGDLPGSAVGGLFSMWVIALAAGQAFFNQRLPVWLRAALLALALGWLFRRFALESWWVTGWLPAFAALFVVTFLRSLKLFALVLVVGLAVIATPMVERVYNQQTVGEESGGNTLRLQIWEQNLEFTKGYWLLGTGVVGYVPYYLTYFPDRAWSSHSNYLDILSQTGVVGSALFLWFMAAVAMVGFRVRTRWPTGFAAGFINGTLGALIGAAIAMALGDWVIPFPYNQTIAGFRYTMYTWLFMGALASMQFMKQAGPENLRVAQPRSAEV